MKFFPNHLVRRPRAVAHGFTLVEMLIAVTVFSLVILATVAMQIFAMRMYTLAATKVTATEEARNTMNDIRDKVREARLLYVGDYTPASGNPVFDFHAMTNGALQEGNALMIYPSTATNSFTLAYLRPPNGSSFSSVTPASTNSLIVVIFTNGVLEASNDVADYITNQIVFDSENFEGSILSSNQNNNLIHMTLNFSQWEYPVAAIGTNDFNAYDYYQLNTVMSRRDGD